MCTWVSMCGFMQTSAILTEARRGHMILWSQSNRCLWAAWNGLWQPISGPLQEQQVLLTTEPFLQTQKANFLEHLMQSFVTGKLIKLWRADNWVYKRTAQLIHHITRLRQQTPHHYSFMKYNKNAHQLFISFLPHKIKKTKQKTAWKAEMSLSKTVRSKKINHSRTSNVG